MLDICGTQIDFRINKWQVYAEIDNCGVNWCDCFLSVKNRYLSYKNTGEFLTQEEVLRLRNVLTALLDDKIEKSFDITNIEPDISFYVEQGHYLYSDEKHFYRDGKMYYDISFEMSIHLSNGTTGYTGEVYSIPFDRNEIKELREVINSELAKFGIR